MWKISKITYWVSTGLFAGLMLLSTFMYITQTEMAKEAYMALGFPTYLLYFNATVKVLGSVAVLQPKFKLIKEWAYAGFSYLLILAVLAHIVAGDGQWAGAFVGLVLLATSYFSYKKLQNN